MLKSTKLPAYLEIEDNLSFVDLEKMMSVRPSSNLSLSALNHFLKIYCAVSNRKLKFSKPYDIPSGGLVAICGREDSRVDENRARVVKASLILPRDYKSLTMMIDQAVYFLNIIIPGETNTNTLVPAILETQFRGSLWKPRTFSLDGVDFLEAGLNLVAKRGRFHDRTYVEYFPDFIKIN